MSGKSRDLEGDLPSANDSTLADPTNDNSSTCSSHSTSTTGQQYPEGELSRQGMSWSRKAKLSSYPNNKKKSSKRKSREGTLRSRQGEKPGDRKTPRVSFADTVTADNSHKSISDAITQVPDHENDLGPLDTEGESLAHQTETDSISDDDSNSSTSLPAIISQLANMDADASMSKSLNF